MIVSCMNYNNSMDWDLAYRMYQIFIISLDIIWAFEFYESHTSVRRQLCLHTSLIWCHPIFIKWRCDRQTAINLCHKFYCNVWGSFNITESGTQEQACMGRDNDYLCLRLNNLHRLQLKKMIYDCIRKCWWLQRS